MRNPRHSHSHSHSSCSENDEESWNLLRGGRGGSTTTTTAGCRLKSPPRTLVQTWLFSRIRALARRGPSSRRRRRSRGTWALCWVVLFGPVVVVLVVLLMPGLREGYAVLPERYQGLVEGCKGLVEGCANPRGERVFIAGVVVGRDGVDGRWGERVVRLVQLLGRKNVFVSVYAVGGGVQGREALEGWRQKLGSRHEIVLEEEAISLKGFRNVTLPDGSQRTKWTSWRAELRNRVLRPLDTFSGGEVDAAFDKVLFLDEDIAFEPVDAAQLLFNTNIRPDGRADYLAACALGFSSPLRLDEESVYTLRDGMGYASGQRIFPYFGRTGRGAFTEPGSSSREQVLARSDAVGVKSCWGGMVAVQGRYLQNLEAGRDTYEFVEKYVVDVNGKPPATAKKPVRFRYELGGYYDADEACLFAADLAELATEEERKGESNSTASTSPRLPSQIFVNPYVRVSTNEGVLSRLDMTRKFERLLVPIFTIRSWFEGRPSVPYVHVQPGDYFDEEIWDGDLWKVIEGRRGRAGMFCGSRGMRVLRTEGEGSTGVELKIPPGWDVAEKRKKWYKRRWNWWWLLLLGSEEEERELPKDWRRIWEDLRRGDRAGFWEVDGG